MNLLKKSLSVLLILACVNFVGCDDKEGDNPVPEYSTSDSKDNLDASLVTTVEKLDGIVDLKSIALFDSLSALDIAGSMLDTLIQPAADVEGVALEDIEDAIEAGLLTLTMSDFIKWGTFTYNFTTDEFDFVEGTLGTLIMLMPSSNSQTTNDVELEINAEFKSGLDLEFEDFITFFEEEYTYDEYGNVTSITKTSTTVDLILKEIFTSISFTLSQDDSKMVEYKMNVELDADDVPTEISTSLYVEGYMVETIFAESDEEASNSTVLTKNDDEIIGFEVALLGDLSDDRITELLDFYEADSLDESFLATIDYDMTCEMRFDHFLVKGLADSEKMYEAYDDYADKDNFSYENMDDVQYVADAMNASMSLALVYDDGAKVGTVEMYVVEKNTYSDSEYDDATESWVPVERVEYYVSPRFKFNDGTYISIEDENIDSELETIFAGFIDAVNDLATDIENL